MKIAGVEKIDDLLYDPRKMNIRADPFCCLSIIIKLFFFYKVLYRNGSLVTFIYKNNIGTILSPKCNPSTAEMCVGVYSVCKRFKLPKSKYSL